VTHTPALDVLAAAGAVAGVDTTGARLIRDGANILYALPGGVVARIGPAGSGAVAEHEVCASRWLTEMGLPVVRIVPGLEQPTEVDGQPVTWWVRLPGHRGATPAELGAVLCALHSLPIPDQLDLDEVDPFEGIAERIDSTRWLPVGDRAWLRALLARLRTDHTDLPPGRPRCVIHGDAWQGNVAVPEHGPPILLDLDHLGIGRPEWDLVSLAVDHTDFARLTAADYQAFTSAYGGYDVTRWPGFRTLATIRELRWTTFVLSKAEANSAAASEAGHRIACLQGKVDRPWTWSAF
jgi:aminoglycoside phosphotransferase (APT) family kinase protein